MRAVVTGASGFLGREIVRQARAKGHDVVATGRRAGNGDAGYHAFDILDLAAVRGLVSGADAVVHAAGLAHVFDPRGVPPARFMAVNADGTANVVRASVEAKVKHVVLVSSVAVYGPAPEKNCSEGAPCRPEGAYAESKWRGEQRALEAIAGSQTSLTILRMATLYGEEDPGNVRRLIRAIDRGRFVWIGDGRNAKSLIHREDAARACLLALRHSGNGPEIYNVSDEPCSMAEVVEAIARALGRGVARWRIPEGLARTLANGARTLAGGRLGTARAASTVRKWLADDAFDARRFRQALSFEPAIRVPEGLEREVMWYRAAVEPA